MRGLARRVSEAKTLYHLDFDSGAIEGSMEKCIFSHGLRPIDTDLGGTPEKIQMRFHHGAAEVTEGIRRTVFSPQMRHRWTQIKRGKMPQESAQIGYHTESPRRGGKSTQGGKRGFKAGFNQTIVLRSPQSQSLRLSRINCVPINN